MLNETVRDHIHNARNSGVIENPDAVGFWGSDCGDHVRFYLKINEEGIVEDARYQAVGCGCALASSSALSEMVKGKTVKDVKAIGIEEVLEVLGGLPEQKVHCSEMSRNSLMTAVHNFLGESYSV